VAQPFIVVVGRGRFTTGGNRQPLRGWWAFFCCLSQQQHVKKKRKKKEKTMQAVKATPHIN
jgi:hypothetical protein